MGTGTVEVSLTRQVGSKNVVAVISFDEGKFDEQEDKAQVIMEAYDKVVEALDEAEVDLAISTIKDIPIQ